MKQSIFALILIFSCAVSAFAQVEIKPCPTLNISGGGVVRPGQPMIFTVNVIGLSDISNLKYKWEISNGAISSDPESPAITIDTTGLNADITAKVKVEGLPANCINTGSETGTVFRGGHLRVFDEFGRLSNNDILARIQNLYVELGNYSDGHGYIINYGTNSEFAARERQIQRAIKRLNLDATRVMIINGGENFRGKGIWTRVYIVPKDVDISPLVK